MKLSGLFEVREPRTQTLDNGKKLLDESSWLTCLLVVQFWVFLMISSFFKCLSIFSLHVKMTVKF